MMSPRAWRLFSWESQTQLRPSYKSVRSSSSRLSSPWVSGVHCPSCKQQTDSDKNSISSSQIRRTSCGVKAQQTPSPCCASRHRTVSPNWPKIESGRPIVAAHLTRKFHANWSSRFIIILLTKKQTKKERKIHTNNEIDRKQYPVPQCIGDGVTKPYYATQYFTLQEQHLCHLF